MLYGNKAPVFSPTFMRQINVRGRCVPTLGAVEEVVMVDKMIMGRLLLISLHSFQIGQIRQEECSPGL